MEEQDARNKREDATTEEWARKFDDAVGILMMIAPKRFTSSLGRISLYIFSEPEKLRFGHRYAAAHDYHPGSPPCQHL
jgi:hypothetical protein